MASAATVDHRALDGTAYRLASALDLELPFTSVAEVTVGGRLLELTAGPAGLGEDIAASLGITEFESELSFQGGTLRTAVKSEYDAQTKTVEKPMLVVWQGKRFSLVTRLYRLSLRDVLGMLRTLNIAEHDEGITLTPERAAGSRFARPASVIKEVPGVGLVEMSRVTAEHTAQLPPWKGVKVESGELYRDTLSDGSPFFVLSSRDVWATVVPLADTDVERVPDRVGRLTLRLAD
ncbi:hypothetical protein H181DRAFT_04810 [Streptomyces sp. WMMB 714]|jgi:hypothetical protein|uniref:hypothetical protein n=1 Tax=Streptomyces sp. WMMB 714 TaxID=1286822 RepID=UPI0005F76D06|nr:hypothetical protein [Streptomyces sp. WMMB 714]SCK52850.1 hypothetical protein H181DRAFT_04810 [Streptomyces sp. WMMB 714]